MNAPTPPDEERRLLTLRRLAVLDTPAEAVFDALTTLAARVCGTPISLLSFIDSDRQWFKSRIGAAESELPREVAFCAHAILESGTLEIEDALADPRFATNPLVTGDPRIRFYAGAPIRLGEGSALGTLCVLDTRPRSLSIEQRTVLEDLAALAAAQLESKLSRPDRELLEETTRLNEELSALVTVTDSAISTLELPKLLDVLLERLVHVMKADAGAILLVEGHGLVVRAVSGFSATAAARPPIPIGQGVGGRIVESGQPLHVADVRTDDRVLGPFLAQEGIISMLGVPLRARDRLVGALHVDWRSPHAESPSDIHLLSIAAERCAAAIVNANLYEELRAANAEADRVRERLTLAVGAADLGIWDWDVPTGRVVWNEDNERIFGMPPGGYDGSYETFLGCVHPEDRSTVVKAIQDALSGAPYAPTFRIVWPNGEVRWLAVRGRFQRAPDGSPLRLLGVTSDVTEQRRTEARLESTNTELRALSARLQTVREEEAMRISREIHDELGQLMTALRMDIRFLRSRLERLGSPDAAALVSRADAMADLAEQTLRSVQRISEELRPAALDQLGLEAALAAQLDALSERSGIRTRLAGTLDDRRLPAATETSVFRIVQELLTNVARHASAATVLVELGIAPGAGGETLTVRVTDDGRGLQPREYGAARSLGLTGIRERALLLGGTAEIRSEPGRGTVATISIPCGPASP